ncbi:MAG: protein-glutamate O-methyltransferase CheR [Proteobacteria bacterium]|nr:protein-glutamate O-methyltransferase CheR [Pseudomonadota bacterium]MBU0967134.1 protein-glutamate O-methyltransferase CheR [Pseudomonadota bacterium]
MDIKLQAEEFALIRRWVEEISGISVDDRKGYLIENRLGGLVAENRCSSFGEFYQKFKTGCPPILRDRIIDQMTTNETLWFRDMHPFNIFKEILLPAYCQEIAAGKRRTIRVWSSACSTGQEPYSLAILFLEAIRTNNQLKRGMIEIMASDISDSVLAQAKSGFYDKIAVNRGLQAEYRSRYFTDEGRLWHIAPEVKEMVKFQKFNLQDPFMKLGSFDIIFCRNVAIYFSEKFKRELFAKYARILTKGGILFLGSSESISLYSNEYDMLEHNKGIYYRVRK